MRFYVSLLFCLLFAGLSPIYGQQAHQQIESQIIAFEHKYWEAWKNKDAKTLAQLRTDDFREADEDGVWNKTQAAQGEIDMEITSYKLWNEKVSMLQPGVALLTSEVAYTSSYKGVDDSSPHSYVAWLFVLRDGNWRVLYSQDSVAKKPQVAPVKNDGGTGGTNELLEIENDLLNAYVHRDLSVRDRYVAGDFVGLDGDGNTYTKQQDMQDLKDGTFAMKSFKLDDVQVRLLGDTAIVTGRNTATTVYKGKEETGTTRFADTFQKRDGRWQMVYSQDTNVADAKK